MKEIATDLFSFTLPAWAFQRLDVGHPGMAACAQTLLGGPVPPSSPQELCQGAAPTTQTHKSPQCRTDSSHSPGRCNPGRGALVQQLWPQQKQTQPPAKPIRHCEAGPGAWLHSSATPDEPRSSWRWIFSTYKVQKKQKPGFPDSALGTSSLVAKKPSRIPDH